MNTMNTLGLVLSSLPIPHRGHDVCPVLFSYFSTNVYKLFVIFLKYWVPFGIYFHAVVRHFCIFVLAFDTSFFIHLGMDFGITFDVFVDTFSARARNLHNNQTPLFLQ